MIATETAKTALLILFGLSILWIIVIVVKNDMQTIVRALIVAALLGLGLYYVNQTKLERLSFRAIKEELFPVKPGIYTFHKREATLGDRTITDLVEGGKYMAIKDVRGVNAVLQYLGLPPVKEGVPELASLTGRSLDADKYRWDNYERGILLIERGICRNMSSAQTFTCIVRISLTNR